MREPDTRKTSSNRRRKRIRLVHVDAEPQKRKENRPLSEQEIRSLWAQVQLRDLITALEVKLFYIPLSVSAILNGDCGTSKLTRIEMISPGKQKGRVLFIRSEVERFCKDTQDTAAGKNESGLYALGEANAS